MGDDIGEVYIACMPLFVCMGDWAGASACRAWYDCADGIATGEGIDCPAPHQGAAAMASGGVCREHCIGDIPGMVGAAALVPMVKGCDPKTFCLGTVMERDWPCDCMPGVTVWLDICIGL